MEKQLKKDISALFERWAEESAKQIEAMTAHGSDRRYYRISGATKTAIGVHNQDFKENIAFLSFSKHFHTCELPVPEIYDQELDKNIYLEQDLGDTTLFSFLTSERQQNGFSEKVVNLYEEVIDQLVQFQVSANEGLDYSVCYPRHSFDRQSMMWDLSYFKYYFLKLAKISFNEQELEDDFQKFCDFLLSTERDFFLYRDFQSRNVMIVDGKPWFIDYQGGRKGALQYDLASLLYDAKADIPQEVRYRLLERYLDKLSELIPVNRKKFLQFYHGYVFIRIMQALGAYGFRGFYERKEHFLKSVPYAIKNLEYLITHADLPVELPALAKVWNGLVRSSVLRQFGDAQLRTSVRIQSFSYRRGIPVDEKGHGGGYVFDCRLLPNPGRYGQYKQLTGSDKEVIEFLEKETEVDSFLGHVIGIIEQMIQNYQKRNFTDIMVAFGCTGGQHRSVYCANFLARYLKEKYDLDLELRHREQEFRNLGVKS